jgi:prepilin-type N-terminal cleavage/methylation domain-containing protein
MTTNRTMLDSGERRVPVFWHEHSWRPDIRVRAGRASFPRRGFQLIREPGWLFTGAALRSFGHQPPSTLMNSIHPSLVPVHGSRRIDRGCSANRPPATNGRARPARAFTLIEMLVVIGIIAILAGILLPTVAMAKVKAQIRKAHTEVKMIEQAIISYHSTYSRYPVSGAILNAAVANNEDFTYGASFKSFLPPPPDYMDLPDLRSNLLLTNQNAEVIAILMDAEYYQNGSATPNKDHVKNPQQIKFLSAKLSGAGAASKGQPGLPGIDLVGTYRDPWGFPYVISMDLNYDEKCMDSLYRRKAVSQMTDGRPEGFEGLFNSTDKDSTGRLTASGDNFSYNGGVMVWSAGPDRLFDPTTAANKGANRDNIASWH